MMYKRKLEGRTDYKKRLRYLLSKKPRLVIRKSNNQIFTQIIEYIPDGDKTLVSATSKELAKFGYKGAIKNTPSAYLTGLLIANKAKEKSIKTVISDIGFYNVTKGSLLFALIKGVKDAGLGIELEESILPNDQRIKGEHISQHARQKNLSQEKISLSSNFEEVKSKLLGK